MSSAASYLFAAARHAFLICTVWSRLRSLFFSEEMLCHMEIDTSGAHSFLTIPLSNDWKALIMKQSRFVLIIADSVPSRVIDSIRRKREENSEGLSEKMSTAC